MKQLIEFPGYSVDENGNIYGKRGLMSPAVGSDGYMHISIRKDKKIVRQRVHRLVALTLIPKPEGKDYVNHINGNRTDNRVVNLEWVTNSENVQHAYDTGAYGDRIRSHSVIVTNLDGSLVGEFKSIRELTKQLPVNRHNVSRILRGHKVNTYPYKFKYLTHERATTIESAHNELSE